MQLKEKTAKEQLDELMPDLPLAVKADIKKRVEDWLMSGGSESDPYIEQQLRFAKYVASCWEHQSND